MNRKSTAPEALKKQGIAWRRDLHRHPEIGFLEYRTASMIITTLRELGFTVKYGKDANDTSLTAGLPSRDVQEACMRRAIEEGADPALVQEMADGQTGIVAILDGTAGGAGQTVAFRFDMDANDVSEETDEAHRPAREGFSSVHANVMHACGHDGHVAIGLMLAHLLSAHRADLSGQVRLIFQPAEEGVRGAESMLRAGAVDGVDVFFGTHIGLSAQKNGMLIASVGEFLAASKFDAVFTGKSSHAGVAPEEGRNALLASAQAAIALHAISRHGKGASRISVGVLHAGTGRNVLPDRAEMGFETRGETREINDYMEAEARRIIRASADMYGVSASLERIGYAEDFVPDPAFGREIADFARSLGTYETVTEYGRMCASEDCTAFMNAVTASGGRATYMMLGTVRTAGHHNGRFDFDESVLSESAEFLYRLALRYTVRSERSQA
jgi:aminobenzoyl-glutamate utilization protein A